MDILALRVHGFPVAQPRPRARIFQAAGGPPRVSMYDPANAKDWKRTVIAQVLPVKPAVPVEGPLAVTLAFELPRPTSLPKRVVHHVKRPDCDNLAKSVKDALRGIVYRDDSQVVDLRVTKSYGAAPGVLIRVTWLGGHSDRPATSQRTFQGIQ